MFKQLCFVPGVEAQTGQDGYGCHNDVQDGDPDVCKVHAVALFAVDSDGECDDGRYPDDDTGRNELEDSIPDALRVVSKLPPN